VSVSKEKNSHHKVIITSSFLFYSSFFLGKTCLLVRFKDDTFICGSFIATVGIDFRNKTITINDKQVKLQIYDTVCNLVLINFFQIQSTHRLSHTHTLLLFFFLLFI